MAGPGIAINELPEEETEAFGFASLGKDATVSLENPLVEPEYSSKLLAIANGRGVFAVAVAAGFIIGDVKSMRAKFLESNKTYTAPTVPISKKLKHILFTSSEEFVVAVDVEGSIACYAVDEVQATPGAAPVWSTTGPEIIDVKASPGIGSVVAALTAENSLYLIDLRQKQKKMIGGGASTSFDWTVDGSELIIGSKEGDLTLYDLQGKAKTTIPHPGDDVPQKYVSMVSCIKPDQFLVIYANPPAPDEHEYSYFTVTKSGASITFSKIVELCPPFGSTSREGWWYSLVLNNWDPELEHILILAATPSIDLSLLTPEHSFFLVDDTKRATLPLFDSADTSPAGLALDLTAIDKIRAPLPSIDECAPQPMVWLLNNQGQLKIWNLMWYDGIKAGKAGVEGIMEKCEKQIQQAKQAAPLSLAVEQQSTATDEADVNSTTTSPLGSEYVDVSKPGSEDEKTPAEDSPVLEKPAPAPADSEKSPAAAEPEPKPKLTPPAPAASETTEKSPAPALNPPKFTFQSTTTTTPATTTTSKAETSLSSLFNATKIGTDEKKTPSSSPSLGSAPLKSTPPPPPSGGLAGLAAAAGSGAASESPKSSLFSRYADAPPLGAGSSTTSSGASTPAFGQGAPAFGQSGFGQPSPFGQLMTGGGAPAFGQASPIGHVSSSSSTPTFGQSSGFGQSGFGQKPAASIPGFGASPFGQAGGSTFGSGSPSPFSAVAGKATGSAFSQYASENNPLASLAKSKDKAEKEDAAAEGKDAATTKEESAVKETAQANLFSIKGAATTSASTSSSTAPVFNFNKPAEASSSSSLTPKNPPLFKARTPTSSAKKIGKEKASPGAMAFGARLGAPKQGWVHDESEDEDESEDPDYESQDDVEEESGDEDDELEYDDEDYDDEEEADEEYDVDEEEDEEDEEEEEEEEEDALAATMKKTTIDPAKFTGFGTPTVAKPAKAPGQTATKELSSEKATSSTPAAFSFGKTAEAAEAKPTLFSSSTQPPAVKASGDVPAPPQTSAKEAELSETKPTPTLFPSSSSQSTATKAPSDTQATSQPSPFSILKPAGGAENAFDLKKTDETKKEETATKLPGFSSLSLAQSSAMTTTVAASVMKDASTSPILPSAEEEEEEEEEPEPEPVPERIPIVPEFVGMHSRPLTAEEEDNEARVPGMTRAFETVYADTEYELDIVRQNAENLAAYVRAHSETAPDDEEEEKEKTVEDLANAEEWRMSECGAITAMLDDALAKVRAENESFLESERTLYKVATGLIKLDKRMLVAKEVTQQRSDEKYLARLKPRALPPDAQDLQRQIRQKMRTVYTSLESLEKSNTEAKSKLSFATAPGSPKSINSGVVSGQPSIEGVQKSIQKITKYAQRRAQEVTAVQREFARLTIEGSATENAAGENWVGFSSPMTGRSSPTPAAAPSTPLLHLKLSTPVREVMDAAGGSTRRQSMWLSTPGSESPAKVAVDQEMVDEFTARKRLRKRLRKILEQRSEETLFTNE